MNPETITDWENSCQQYFLHAKGLAVSDCVSHVTAGFQDRIIQNWWRINQKSLITLGWDEFIEEFRNTFLDTNWDLAVLSDILALRM